MPAFGPTQSLQTVSTEASVPLDQADLAALLEAEHARSAGQITAVPLDGRRDVQSFSGEAGDGNGRRQMRLIRQPAWSKWLLTAVIAIFIGSQCACISIVEQAVFSWRMQQAEVLQRNDLSTLAVCFILFHGVTAGLLAALLVVKISPRAAMSGLRDVKAYLNANFIPGAMSFETWAARSLGMLLVSGSGVLTDVQSPCAHLGAIVARGIAGGRLHCAGIRVAMPWRMLGHRTQFEFTSAGAAMGTAAAFGAPVGGVLYSLEEAYALLSCEATLRIFFGAVFASFVAKVVRHGRFHSLPAHGFVEFPDAADLSFEAFELAVFAALGLITGCFGALCCVGVKHMCHLRKYVTMLFLELGWSSAQTLRLAEVACLTALMLFVFHFLPFLFPCRTLADGDTDDEILGFVGTLDRGHCPEGEYSALSTLLVESKHFAVRCLFTRSFHGKAVFEVGELLVCAFIVLALTVVSFGMQTPFGIFLPNMLVGGCLGRAVGECMERLRGAGSVHPGLYALVGCAGQVAGVSRMTVSLTMIMVETTGNIRTSLPLMLAVAVSKGIADQLHEASVVDIGLELGDGVKLVNADALHAGRNFEGLTIHDVCTAEVHVVQASERLSRILKLLVQTKFKAYPLVAGREARVVGLVRRSSLVRSVSDHCNTPLMMQANIVIDLMKHADIAPDVKHWRTPLPRACAHFQAMNLQQLCLVDESHCLLGIVTRSDLARLGRAEGCRLMLEALQRRAKASEEYSSMMSSTGTGASSSSAAPQLTRRSHSSIESSVASEAPSCPTPGSCVSVSAEESSFFFGVDVIGPAEQAAGADAEVTTMGTQPPSLTGTIAAATACAVSSPSSPPSATAVTATALATASAALGTQGNGFIRQLSSGSQSSGSACSPRSSIVGLATAAGGDFAGPAAAAAAAAAMAAATAPASLCEDAPSPPSSPLILATPAPRTTSVPRTRNSLRSDSEPGPVPWASSKAAKSFVQRRSSSATANDSTQQSRRILRNKVLSKIVEAEAAEEETSRFRLDNTADDAPTLEVTGVEGGELSVAGNTAVAAANPAESSQIPRVATGRDSSSLSLISRHVCPAPLSASRHFSLGGSVEETDEDVGRNETAEAEGEETGVANCDGSIDDSGSGKGGGVGEDGETAADPNIATPSVAAVAPGVDDSSSHSSLAAMNSDGESVVVSFE